ncbi:hypothetical protein O3P69_003496 [Scylla paramamosain]|uniref:Uncharacterized protein n=1 Tax=Scylla paramamosain TaxID=85552 RepID=A0AAW0UHA6_SCYPA
MTALMQRYTMPVKMNRTSIYSSTKGKLTSLRNTKPRARLSDAASPFSTKLAAEVEALVKYPNPPMTSGKRVKMKVECVPMASRTLLAEASTLSLPT